MTLSCFYQTDHEFFIFWKQFSLPFKDEQIKKFTRQGEYPLAIASGRVEFSSPVPLIVASFKTWFPLNLILLYHSKIFFDISDTKDVCPFIAYSVTEFETILRSHILAIFILTANSAK